MIRIVLAGATAAVLVLTAAVTGLTAPQRVGAADHLDAPGLTPPGGDPRADITDLYAFRTTRGRTALVLNVNGLTAPGKRATFAASVPSVAETRRVSYEFRVDNNGDARADVVLSVRFGRPAANGRQRLTLLRNGKVVLRGWSSPGAVPRVNSGKGARVFAGPRDDPFFFDLQGFLDILGPGTFIGCDSPRPDAFAGTNVSSLVLEVPSSWLTRRGSSQVGVWATTTWGGKQIDRMGRPAIATVFIPANPFEAGEASQKSAFNAGIPARDRAAFRGEVVDTLTTLFSLNDAAGDDASDDAGKIAGLADVLLPDVLTFDTASSAGFLNGRWLADDVIDAELGLITEGAVTTDCVDRNDRVFLRGFPYLAAPHA